MEREPSHQGTRAHGPILRQYIPQSTGLLASTSQARDNCEDAHTIYMYTHRSLANIGVLPVAILSLGS